MATRLKTHPAKCSECGRPPCIEFSRLCRKHHDERTAKYRPIALARVAKMRLTHPHRFVPKEADAFWRQMAGRWVKAAKDRGVLPVLDGSIACVDCGDAATAYEHRDYSRPLDVEPVCASCNSKRGTAKWPSPDQFNFSKVAA